MWRLVILLTRGPSAVHRSPALSCLLCRGTSRHVPGGHIFKRQPRCMRGLPRRHGCRLRRFELFAVPSWNDWALDFRVQPLCARLLLGSWNSAVLAVRGWARVPDHIRYGGVSSWLHSSVTIAVLHAVSGGLCMPARGPAGGSGSLYAGDVLSGGAGCLHGVSGGLRLPGDGPRLAAGMCLWKRCRRGASNVRSLRCRHGF
jgi:hypothetical protein